MNGTMEEDNNYKQFGNSSSVLCSARLQKLEALQKQKQLGVAFGEKEEKSAFLTYLLSQTDLTPQEVNSNCVDLMMGAVETVRSGRE